MFDVGFWELVLISILGLLVLGPERLPRVATQLGNWAGQARRMARMLTTQLRDELDKETRRAGEAGMPDSGPAAETRYSRPGIDELRTAPATDAGADPSPTDTPVGGSPAGGRSTSDGQTP